MTVQSVQFACRQLITGCLLRSRLHTGHAPERQQLSQALVILHADTSYKRCSCSFIPSQVLLRCFALLCSLLLAAAAVGSHAPLQAVESSLPSSRSAGTLPSSAFSLQSLSRDAAARPLRMACSVDERQH